MYPVLQKYNSGWFSVQIVSITGGYNFQTAVVFDAGRTVSKLNLFTRRKNAWLLDTGEN